MWVLDIKGVPGFWSSAITNNSTIGGLVTEEDLEALSHITDIRVEYNEAWSGFTLIFSFSENKFFTNTVSLIINFHFYFRG